MRISCVVSIRDGSGVSMSVVAMITVTCSTLFGDVFRCGYLQYLDCQSGCPLQMWNTFVVVVWAMSVLWQRDDK